MLEFQKCAGSFHEKILNFLLIKYFLPLMRKLETNLDDLALIVLFEENTQIFAFYHFQI